MTNGTAWLVTDRQGSVRDVLDGSGTLQDTIAYTVFGQITTETNSNWTGNFTYTGLYNDRATVNLDAKYRQLQTDGTWNAKDQTGFNAGDANLQRYAGNNGPNGVDPSGLEKKASELLPPPQVIGARFDKSHWVNIDVVKPNGFSCATSEDDLKEHKVVPLFTVKAPNVTWEVFCTNTSEGGNIQGKLKYEGQPPTAKGTFGKCVFPSGFNKHFFIGQYGTPANAEADQLVEGKTLKVNSIFWMNIETSSDAQRKGISKIFGDVFNQKAAAETTTLDAGLKLVAQFGKECKDKELLKTKQAQGGNIPTHFLIYTWSAEEPGKPSCKNAFYKT